jgi:hypothetical protein
MPQPLGNPPPLAPLPTLVTLPPDARTQEMIKEKLKKAEELGTQSHRIISIEQLCFVVMHVGVSVWCSQTFGIMFTFHCPFLLVFSRIKAE